ncbi:MAG: hypothetical protein AAGG53_06495 [Cyanobacteria bacterium P01_H01_bin.152]
MKVKYPDKTVDGWMGSRGVGRLFTRDSPGSVLIEQYGNLMLLLLRIGIAIAGLIMVFRPQLLMFG